MRNEYSKQKNIDFIIVDCISLIVSFCISYLITGTYRIAIFQELYKALLIVSIMVEVFLSVVLNQFFNVLKRDVVDEVKKTISFIFIQLVLALFIVFLIKGQIPISRKFYIYYSFLYFFISIFTRMIHKKIITYKAKRSSVNGNKTLLVVTSAKNMYDISRLMDTDNYSFYRLIGLCVIDKDLKDNYVGNHKIIINYSELLDYISNNWVDDIYFDVSVNNISPDLLSNLSETGITVHIRLSELEMFVGQDRYIENVLSYPTLSVCVKERSFNQLLIKRLFDIFCGLIGCILTLIIAIVVGPIIYIKSPGPIIYSSTRIGENGKPFKFYKFRSMIINADDYKEELKEFNRVKDNLMFKMDDDPRIIPGIGKFIRQYSLDEFPQFFNVLKGDMSVVGTRPPTLDEWNKYKLKHRIRMSIKPGITGMWQVSGRSKIVDFDEVVRLDTYYIYRWSLRLDIEIIVDTFRVMIKKDGAI